MNGQDSSTWSRSRLPPQPACRARVARRRRSRRGPGTGRRAAPRSRRCRERSGRRGPNRGRRRRPAVRSRSCATRQISSAARPSSTNVSHGTPTSCGFCLRRREHLGDAIDLGHVQFVDDLAVAVVAAVGRQARRVPPTRRATARGTPAQARSPRTSRLPQTVSRLWRARWVSWFAPSLDTSSLRDEETARIRGGAAARFVVSRNAVPQFTGPDRGRCCQHGAMTPTSAGPLEVAQAEDVLLRDGSTLRLRPPSAADEAALISFFESLSPDSRYLRFHGTTLIDHGTVAGALETDWASRGSLLGRACGRRRRAAHRRARHLCAAARSGPRGGGVRRRRRAARPRDRDAAARAARRARFGRGHRPSSSPRCCRRTRDAPRVRRRRLRDRPDLPGRRDRGRALARARRALRAARATGGTTSVSPRRCGRSSRRPRSR